MRNEVSEMFGFFRKRSDTKDYMDYLRNEYRSEWKNYRQHLYNPMVRDETAVHEFLNSLDR
jgi:hypothetical protein